MKYDKEKLLTLRENINRYLHKAEAEEKDRYKQIVLSFKNSQNTIDQVLGYLKGDRSSEELATLLMEMRKEFADAVKAVSPDMRPLIGAITDLSKQLLGKKDFTDVGIITTLNRIEKLLGEKPKKITDRTDEIVNAIKEIKLETSDIAFPDSIAINNFPPTKTPQPVTNININALQGFVHTTSATIGTSITQLPEYGQLFNRRALIIYNNSLNMIYVGGSDVTTANGMPIPANSYSSPIDAGYNLIVYGIASQNGNNVRVMEISKDKSDTVQQ